jgi:hypothetical protein
MTKIVFRVAFIEHNSYDDINLKGYISTVHYNTVTTLAASSLVVVLVVPYFI